MFKTIHYFAGKTLHMIKEEDIERVAKATASSAPRKSTSRTAGRKSLSRTDNTTRSLSIRSPSGAEGSVRLLSGAEAPNQAKSIVIRHFGYAQ